MPDLDVSFSRTFYYVRNRLFHALGIVPLAQISIIHQPDSGVVDQHAHSSLLVPFVTIIINLMAVSLTCTDITSMHLHVESVKILPHNDELRIRVILIEQYTNILEARKSETSIPKKCSQIPHKHMTMLLPSWTHNQDAPCMADVVRERLTGLCQLLCTPVNKNVDLISRFRFWYKTSR